MKTVYKYHIQITDIQEIDMPFGAELLHAGLDPAGLPCVWAHVDNLNTSESVKIAVTDTGSPMPEGDVEHVGSFVDGSFVWHVWRINK